MVDFPRFASLSNIGYSKYKVSREGDVWSFKYGKWKKLKPGTQMNGYRFVFLSNDCRPKKFLVHRLVLIAFKGQPKNDKTQGRHLDGNSTNNRISNLAWGTSHDNARDMIRHGRTKLGRTFAVGSKYGAAKLDEAKVKKMIKMAKSQKITQKELGLRFGVTQPVVSKILLGQSWRHISNPKTITG